ncbi:hypothetical protein V2O64_01385 [Verrucomicrobiaceae bacterium 227]
MNGGGSKRFKPVEPGANKGGFRKVQRGEGRARVRGVIVDSDDRWMKIHGAILLGISLLVPVSMILGIVLEASWTLGLFWASMFLSIMYLIVVEVVTGKEIVRRGWAMVLTFSPFVIGVIASAFE